MNDSHEVLTTSNAAIYFIVLKWLTVRRLKSLPGVRVISSDGGFLSPPKTIQLDCGKDSLKLNVLHTLDDEGERSLVTQRTGMTAWLRSLGNNLHAEESDFLCAFMAQVKQAYAIVPSRPFVASRADPIWEAILALASVHEGVVFTLDSIIDFQGHVLAGQLRMAADQS